MLNQLKKRNQFHKILPVLMVILVLILDICFFAMKDRELSETENRTLQQLPKVTWTALTNGRFESQFEDYVADQFPFRDTWIGAETTLQRLAGNTMSHDIFLAGDGYLIQRFEEPTQEAYEEKVRSFTEISAAHPELPCYALVAPTAVSVMERLLPANAVGTIAGDENAFLDRLFQDLRAAGIRTVDVRAALGALRDQNAQVYYRTDHHWTSDAAYAAYQAFAAQAELADNAVPYERLLVSDHFQGTLSASSGFRSEESDAIYVYLPVANETEGRDFDYIVTNVDTGEKWTSFYDTSFLETRDEYAMFLGGNHGELKIQSTGPQEKHLLVLKDSYANCMIPFLAPDYGIIIVVDPRYYLGDLEQLIRDEEISEILFLYNAETL